MKNVNYCKHSFYLFPTFWQQWDITLGPTNFSLLVRTVKLTFDGHFLRLAAVRCGEAPRSRAARKIVACDA